MAEVVTNASPLLYLYRVGALDWLPELFQGVITPQAVVQELLEGQRRGYDIPDPGKYPWLRIVEPHAVPSEWLALDLGAGELAVLAYALEDPSRTVLLDDSLARRIAHAAGLQVWGTLKVLLEAKSRGLVERVEPVIDHLEKSGMWISASVRQRVLALAKEAGG